MTCARFCSCTLIRTQNLLQARPTPAPDDEHVEMVPNVPASVRLLP
jgi:hypothetical protein